MAFKPKKNSNFSEFKRKFLGYIEMVFHQEKVSKKDEKFVAFHEKGKKLDFYRKIAKMK